MPAGGRPSRPIRFQGPPFLVEAVVDFPVSPSASAHLGVTGLGRSSTTAGAGLAGPDEAVLGVSLATVGPGHGLAQLVLPPSTPPGRYEASLSVEGVDYPAEVVITPRAELRSVPTSLDIDAAPGTEVATEVQVLNSGNVALTLDVRSEFGLSEANGLDRALRTALSETAGRGQERVAELLDQLAAAEAGPAEVEVTEGAGELAPGEARWLTATIRFPPRLVPGRTYAGSWPMGGTSLRVRVRAVEGTKPKPRGRASKEAR